jgi:hypothetical protein
VALRLAYRSGVTVGVTAPDSSGFLSGLSTAFSTGSPHKLAPGAVLQDVAALHISIDSSSPSVSTHIAALRNLLKGGDDGDLGDLFNQVYEVGFNFRYLFVFSVTLIIFAPSRENFL